MMNMNSKFAASERTPFLCDNGDSDINRETEEGQYNSNSNSTTTHLRHRFLGSMLAVAATLVLLSISEGKAVFRRSNIMYRNAYGNLVGQTNVDVDADVDGVKGSSSSSSSNEDLYLSFDEFLHKFDKTDEYGSEEEEEDGSESKKEEDELSANNNGMSYGFRKAIYEENLEIIRAHNQDAKALKHSWTMGINKFADLLPHEIPKGFHKGLPHGPNSEWSSSSSSSSHHVFSSLVQDQQQQQQEEEQQQHAKNHRSLEGLSATLPDSVDWRTHGVTTPVKDQGRCGSCWAFAATAVLESHAAIASGNSNSNNSKPNSKPKLMVLSPQELVSCAPNPDHCGGDGGCSGSTGELAYDYVSKHGMVTEWAYGYTSYGGDTGQCKYSSKYYSSSSSSNNNNDNNDNEPDHSFRTLPGAKVALMGYSSLPSNSYDALMYAVATMGPVVVSVAANTWGLYRGGVFDDSEVTTHYDMNHAVVLEGYGTDETSGLDYWLVRNSWGVLWGEDGYIRLRRNKPSRGGSSDSDSDSDLDDKKDCKTDITPSHGVACTGPDGNATIPDQWVCGTSGILYANVVPVGAHLV